GETDPWSTGQFKPRSSKRADNYRFMVPDAGHWSTIFSLTGEDRDTAAAALARWLDLPAPVSAAAKGLYVLRPTTPSKTPENVFASAADHTTDAERLEYIKYIVTNKIPARR
ncbi:MAG: hypothetical protein MJK04_04815, partial [Psychrosphaera sp.]|nr:hypothetical protein [Psychrosphaera sp.]